MNSSENKFFLNKAFLVKIILLVKLFGFGQTSINSSTINKKHESFFELNRDTIKREIASFNLACNYTNNGNEFAKKKVNEIPFTKCTENSIQFIVSDIISTKLIVNVASTKFDSTKHNLKFDTTPQHNLLQIDNKDFWGTNGKIPKENVSFLRSLHGPHVTAKIPDSAFAGIFEPKFCKTILEGKHEKTVSNCKLFWSEDKRRRYIYMINGSGESTYEVTWVIEDCKYKLRVIDKIK
jgi:hypothetical protein